MALSKAKLKVTLRGLLGVAEGADPEIAESFGAGVDTLRNKLATATIEEMVEGSVESVELGIDVEEFVEGFKDSLVEALASRKKQRDEEAAAKAKAAKEAAAAAAASKK